MYINHIAVFIKNILKHPKVHLSQYLLQNYSASKMVVYNILRNSKCFQINFNLHINFVGRLVRNLYFPNV